MTVKELIHALQTYDLDALVSVWSGGRLCTIEQMTAHQSDDVPIVVLDVSAADDKENDDPHPEDYPDVEDTMREFVATQRQLDAVAGDAPSGPHHDVIASVLVVATRLASLETTVQFSAGRPQPPIRPRPLIPLPYYSRGGKFPLICSGKRDFLRVRNAEVASSSLAPSTIKNPK